MKKAKKDCLKKELHKLKPKKIKQTQKVAIVMGVCKVAKKK